MSRNANREWSTRRVELSRSGAEDVWTALCCLVWLIWGSFCFQHDGISLLALGDMNVGFRFIMMIHDAAKLFKDNWCLRLACAVFCAASSHRGSCNDGQWCSATSSSSLSLACACWQVSLVLPTLEDKAGLGATYLIFAGIGVASVASIYATVPETKGKTLEEIEALWVEQDKGSWNAFVKMTSQAWDSKLWGHLQGMRVPATPLTPKPALNWSAKSKT